MKKLHNYKATVLDENDKNVELDIVVLEISSFKFRAVSWKDLSPLTCNHGGGDPFETYPIRSSLNAALADHLVDLDSGRKMVLLTLKKVE